MTDYRPRLLSLVSAPVAEPLTLAETKLFLRVDSEAEDSVITGLTTHGVGRFRAFIHA